MGAYWGSKYVAVLTPALDEARVEMFDLRPSGIQDMNSCSESLYLSVGDREDLKGFPVCDTEMQAKIKVRAHLLSNSIDRICELLCAIEYSKHEIEYIKKLDGINADNKRLIDIKNQAITTFKTELKSLRDLRKSKIRVV